MSKHRLILDDEYEFLAFGISCHLKDYRVAAHLNKTLSKDFIRSSIELPIKANQSDVFAKFTAKDDDAHLRYILLTNHNEETYLFPNHKGYDFFLLIEGYIDIFNEAEFTQRLQAIESFQFIASIPKETFEKIQYALFEE